MNDDTFTEKRGEDPDTVRRRAQFDAYWVEQQTRERANSDKYDNTILTYSTGALGLSVAFIKDVIPLADAHALWTLKLSWVMFALSLFLMLASFPIGQAANRRSIEFAEKYFIEKKDDYYNKVGLEAKVLRWLNPLAGLAFFFAAALTTAFVWTNVHERHLVASNITLPTNTAPKMTATNEAIGSTMMRKVTQATTTTKTRSTDALAPAQAGTSEKN